MGNVNSGCICQELVEGPASNMDRVPLSPSIYLSLLHTHINMPERAHTLFRNYFAPFSSPHLPIKLGEIGRLIKISSESLVWLFS